MSVIPLETGSNDLLDSVRTMRGAQVAWASAGLQKRLAVLQDAGKRLMEARPTLHEGLYADGLSEALAQYYGDWICHQGDSALLERYARDLAHWEILPDNGCELTIRRPDGLVLLLTPGNSPTINAAVLFSILLPGNGVLVRAPQNDRGLRFIAEDILQRTLMDHGFSPRLVQVRTDRNRAVLRDAAATDAFSTVVFFGNSEAGKSVAEVAHQHGMKVVLELEGSDHMLVWKDADLSIALHAAQRAFDFSTQPCPIPKHFLVHHALFDTFRAELLNLADGLSVTVEADPKGGVLVPVARRQNFEALLKDVRRHGRVLCGGHAMDAQGEPSEHGPYIQPTIVELSARTCLETPLRCFSEEIGFPLLPLVRCDGDDPAVLNAMLQILKRSPSGLRASLFAQNAGVIEQFVTNANDYGLLLINEDHARCPTYASPWGGPKRSGGTHGESHFFWQKTSHLQAISCNALSAAQRQAVATSLGIPEPERNAAPSDIDLVGLRIENGIARISLQRTDKHNAVNTALQQALDHQLDVLESQLDSVGCVILHGAGDSFCSGADLKELGGFTPQAARRFMLDATQTFRRFQKLPVPVIAAVDGYCLGGGMELALHTDIVIASERAVFGCPESRHGLITTTGASSRLSKALGTFRARQLLLTGKQLSAAEAKLWGLVTEIAPAEQLLEAAEAMAQRFVGMPRAGLKAFKERFEASTAADFDHAWTAETEAFMPLIHARNLPSPKDNTPC